MEKLKNLNFQIKSKWQLNMQLARFLNKIFKKGGFILTDANSKDYIIGDPDNNPIKLKILNKNLHYKLLFHPDFILVKLIQMEK